MLGYRSDLSAEVAVRYCTAGWSQPEDDETWCLGSSSTLVLPPTRQVVPHVLVLEMRAYVGDLAGVLSQQIIICVSDITIELFAVTSPTRTVRACIIPSKVLVAGGPVVIVFKTPNAVRGPAGDNRVLAFAFRSLQLFPDKLALATSPSQLDAPASEDFGPTMLSGEIPVSELMLKFESLGQNCVKPRPGSWARLQEHILKIVCAGDKNLRDWLMGWMARLVQCPGEQGEVAVVMRGIEGCGKGTLAKALLHILGQHGMAISNAKHLTGNFNGHLRVHRAAVR